MPHCWRARTNRLQPDEEREEDYDQETRTRSDWQETSLDALREEISRLKEDLRKNTQALEHLRQEKASQDEEMMKSKRAMEQQAEEISRLKEDLRKSTQALEHLRHEKTSLEEVLAKGTQACGQAEPEGTKHESNAAGWILPPYMEDKLEKLFHHPRDEDSSHWQSSQAGELSMDLRLAVEVLRSLAEETSSPEDYKRRVVREWEIACKEEALAHPDVRRSMAKLIPGGSSDRPLEGMLDEETRRACGVRMTEALETAAQRSTTTRSSWWRAGGGNSKFSIEAGAEAIYGTLEEFHGGLVERIGLPNKLDDLYKAMEEEHCNRRDSEETFTPPNYSSPTTPKQEWRAVTDGAERERLSDPDGRRRIRAVEDLMACEIVRGSKLRSEEVLALLLYTGTCESRVGRRGG
eukprot:768736-Hanusia_phi.AAC.6